MTPKYQQMKPPHRDQAIPTTPQGLLEKSACRPGTMSNNRCLAKKPQRLLPEFQPQTHDVGRLLSL